MFVIQDDKTICLTRGDIAIIEIRASLGETEEYVFQPNDVIRLRVVEKKRYDLLVLQKEVVIESETPMVEMFLSREDTKIGTIINKPKDYWYEIELNPDTSSQTIVGYDEQGPKIFRLFPEGVDSVE